MKKMWGGCFKEGLDPMAQKLSFSLALDSRLYRYDILTNKAHCKALHEATLLTDSEHDSLQKTLLDLLQRFEKNESELVGPDEDIHSLIERLVTEALGETGKKLHTGKSRNDQVVTDMRLYLKDQILELQTHLESVMCGLWQLAWRYQKVVFPGMTHFQMAQPVLFAHHMLAYVEMFTRDKQRLSEIFEHTDVCPLGSGALAGNNYGLDRSLIAKELGFSKLTRNSMDGVSDRDFVIEFCSASAQIMLHLSRICEELVLFSSPVMGFVRIGDAFTTGSSIMPQKKNPDVAELIRGKCGRIVGNTMGLMQLMKALPMTYNRDMQEDKSYLFDTVDTLFCVLPAFAKMLSTITLNSTAIEAALKKGYLLATDLADYLVTKGIAFRDAHTITGRIVMYALERQKGLEDLSLNEFKSFCDQCEKDVLKVFDYGASVDQKDVYGGTASKRVLYQLKRLKEEYQWNEPSF